MKKYVIPFIAVVVFILYYFAFYLNRGEIYIFSYWLCVCVLFFFCCGKLLKTRGAVGKSLLALFFSWIQLFYLNYRMTGALNWFVNSYYPAFSTLALGLIASFIIVLIELVEFAIFYKEGCECKGNDLFYHRPYIASLIIIVVWLPFLVVFFPGSYGWDTLFQLRQYFGMVPYSSSTPFLITQIMGGIFSLFRVLSGSNQWGMYGIFICQYLGLALAIGHSIQTLNKMEISKKVKYYIFAFYLVIPVFPAFATFIGKDTFFLIAFMFSVSYAIRICIDVQNEDDGKSGSFVEMVLLGIWLFCLTTFRLNGPIASVPLGIALSWYLFKKREKRKTACLIIVFIPILGWFTLSGIMKSKFNVSSDPQDQASLTLEFLGYLQTANYVRKYPEQVSQFEKDVLSTMWNYDELGTYYSDFYVDMVRNNRICDDNRYHEVWVSMGKRHPSTYLEATVRMSGKYLFLFSPVDNYVGFTMDDSKDGMLDDINVLSKSANLKRYLFTKIYYCLVFFTPLRFFSTTGLYILITLSLTVSMISRKKNSFFVLAIPLISMFFSALLSPAASTRYALPVIAGVPMLFALCKWECKVNITHG